MKPKKRHVIDRLTLTEISAVDNPAVNHARVAIMKSADKKRTDAPTHLKNLEITELSLVDNPANLDSKVMLLKQKKPVAAFTPAATAVLKEAVARLHEIETQNYKETDTMTDIEKIAKSENLTEAQATVRYYENNPSAYLTASAPVAKASPPAPAVETSEFDTWYRKQITKRMDRFGEDEKTATGRVHNDPEFNGRYSQDQMSKAQEAGRRVGLSY